MNRQASLATNSPTNNRLDTRGQASTTYCWKRLRMATAPCLWKAQARGGEAAGSAGSDGERQRLRFVSPQSDSAVRPESHTFLPLFPVEWANFLRLLQIWPMKTRAIRFRARRARVPTRLGSLRSERGNVWEIPKFIRAIVSG